VSRRPLPLLALLAGAALAQAPAPPSDPPPDPATQAPLSERLGWNARERTAAGARALERGDAAGARQALDQALRLRPDDPARRYNAGTGRLADGDPSAGVLLDLAAREAPPELAPSAWYNLGDARLAARDFPGAAAAFIESLKRRPDHAGAKHNLELALRELEKERQRQQQQQGDQQQPNPDQDPSGENGERPQDSGDQNQPDRKEPQGEPDQRPQDGDPQDPQQQNEPGGQRSRPGEQDPSALPQFRDLPDMTAEQAAAILRAVENLEREQRKERAAKAARARRATVEIDW
jgi:Ca-activated chloride channel family protein